MAELARKPAVDEEEHRLSLSEEAAAADALPRPPDTPTGWAVFAIAVVFSLFQIWTAAFNPLSSLTLRSIHVGFLLLLGFAMFRAGGGQDARRVPAIDWALGGLGFLLGLYHWVFEAELVIRFNPTTLDTIVAVAFTALVFEASRRAMGLGLAVVCGLFLAWGLFGHVLPAPLDHRGYGLGQWVSQIYLGTDGIFGVPVLVSATYLFLFVLFGSYLQQAGMNTLFNDLALGLVGHQRGGPAKVANISSAIMGTISGSGIANVVASGVFTIPLMKRFGYGSVFAGAVEASSSMGGQIMPPVMGAVAFIMAETIGVPYAEVAKAAAIPAVLYFAAIQWIIHLEAGRLHLMGLPRDQLPSPLRALRRKWFLLLPLVVLVWLMFGGYTPLFAALVGLLLTVVMILGSTVAAAFGALGLRILFWVVIGIAASAFFKLGVEAVFALIAVLLAAQLFIQGGRKTLETTVVALAEGARNAVAVGLACAVVGVLVAVMNLTGVAISFGSVIIRLGEHSLFLSLVLTMLVCLILGMGLPSIPNYIITASIAGPVLLELGVPLIVSHMFVFYFGIMSNLTPPVALAAFAAAPIARAPPSAIGMASLRIALAGFVIPFMAVYSPALMLQGGGWLDVAYVVLKALVAIGLWGVASVGYFSAPLRLWERAWATAAAFLLVVALPVTDELGFALSAAFVAYQWWRGRQAAIA